MTRGGARSTAGTRTRHGWRYGLQQEDGASARRGCASARGGTVRDLVPSKAVLLDWTVDRIRSEMRLPAPGLPEELAERLRDWREGTFRRTLRIVMDGYRVRRGEERS